MAERKSTTFVAGSELADEADLGLQAMARALLDHLLDMDDQGADVGGRGATRIDQDVGMAGGDHGASDAGPLEAALVDQAAGADARDLLEDGAGARLGVQGRVPLAPPLKVLLHDPAHAGLIVRLELEGGGKDDIPAVVEDGVVVAELEVVDAYRL